MTGPRRGEARGPLRAACGPALLALAIASCDGSSAPAAATADGIPIVQSDRPDWAPGEAWRVAPEPLLRIGTMGGLPELSFVRIASALLLADGGLAVVDGGAAQLRFFDREGRFVRSFGREGDGPGEFRGALTATLVGDSLWMHDAGLNRLTVADTRSEGFRTASLEATNTRHGLAGVLRDGSAVVVADLMFDLTPGDSLPAGPHRFGAAYLRVSPAGATLDTLVVGAGSERVLRYGEQTMEMLRPLFARGPSHAVVGERLYVGDQTTYTLRAHDASGAALLEARRTDVDPMLAEGEYQRAVEARVSAAPEARRPGLRAMYDNQPVPQSRAAHGAFLGDPLGHLWVQDFAAEGSSRRWAVFAPDGTWLGDVELPEAFRPTHVHGERMVGVHTDALGVEYVQVHAIERGTGE